MTPGIRRGLLNQLAAPAEEVRAEAIRALGAAGQRASLPRVIEAVRRVRAGVARA
jgi:HEAT repeat protein